MCWVDLGSPVRTEVRIFDCKHCAHDLRILHSLDEDAGPKAGIVQSLPAKLIVDVTVVMRGNGICFLPRATSTPVEKSEAKNHARLDLPVVRFMPPGNRVFLVV
jgi:hypothetical protein